MCRAIEDGGRRCSAHTPERRSAYRAALKLRKAEANPDGPEAQQLLRRQRRMTRKMLAKIEPERRRRAHKAKDRGVLGADGADWVDTKECPGWCTDGVVVVIDEAGNGIGTTTCIVCNGAGVGSRS